MCDYTASYPCWILNDLSETSYASISDAEVLVKLQGIRSRLGPWQSKLMKEKFDLVPVNIGSEYSERLVP